MRWNYWNTNKINEDLDQIINGTIAALAFVNNVYRKELKIGSNVMFCNKRAIEIECYMLEFIIYDRLQT